MLFLPNFRNWIQKPLTNYPDLYIIYLTEKAHITRIAPVEVRKTTFRLFPLWRSRAADLKPQAAREIFKLHYTTLLVKSQVG